MTTDEVYDGRVLQLKVPATLDGVRIDRAISLVTGRSRADVARLFSEATLTLDGKIATKASTNLRAGQFIEARFASVEDVAVMADPLVAVSVVEEDDDFVVVDKQAGVVVHPGAGQRDATLVAGLLARYPELQYLVEAGICEPERPGIVHRLDRGTSGLLVVARTERGYRSLRHQLDERRVSRQYVGLVEGRVGDPRGIIDAPIGRSVRHPTMMAVRVDGRPARTRYEVSKYFVVPRTTTLLTLNLDTGRTHQIRVHASSIGHPIVNDERYGARRDTRLETGRPFLHAVALSFESPGDGALRTFTSEISSDLSLALSDYSE